MLLPPVGDTHPSPTTGVISKPTITEDPLAFPPVDEDEPMDHSDGENDTDDGGDQSESNENNDNLGDDSDDPGEWDIPSPPSSDKASAYIPLPLTASTEVVDVRRSSKMGKLMARQSSPSQLDIGIPSAGLLLGSVSSEVSVPSPIAALSPIDVPDFLKISLDYLESLTKKVIEVVLAGRDTFETFKPMLVNSLNNLKFVGDVPVVERCSEAIRRLEAQLWFLEVLGRADIQTQIASTLEDIRDEEANKYEAAQRHIAEKEIKVEHLQKLHAKKQTELALYNTSLENLREKIMATEVELARLKAQFK
ncbi:uncharacterized protein A4U43_C08F24560 [Asparagus officinalis]|nr:uncharacterized protein A4U43_C08F24560 [Asparagus officinalis]